MVQLSTSVVLAGAVLSSAVSTLAAPIMNPDAVQARDEELEARIISPFLRTPPIFRNPILSKAPSSAAAPRSIEEEGDLEARIVSPFLRPHSLRIPSIINKAPSSVAAPRSIDEEAGLEARVVRPLLGRPPLSQIRTPTSLFKPNPALHQIASTMRNGRSFDEEADLEARIVSLGSLGRSPPFYTPSNRLPTSGIRPAVLRKPSILSKAPSSAAAARSFDEEADLEARIIGLDRPLGPFSRLPSPGIRQPAVFRRPSILSKAPSSAAAARSFDEEADLEARIIGLDRPLGPFSRLPSPGIRQPAVFRRPSVLSKAPSSAAARSFDEGADLEARLLFKRPPPFYKMSRREIEDRDFEIDELD